MKNSPRASDKCAKGKNQFGFSLFAFVFLEEIAGELFSARKTSQRSVATEIFRKRNITVPPHPLKKAPAKMFFVGAIHSSPAFVCKKADAICLPFEGNGVKHRKRCRTDEVTDATHPQFSDRRGRRSLQKLLIFTVGAIHESPIYICGNRSFFTRRP